MDRLTIFMYLILLCMIPLVLYCKKQYNKVLFKYNKVLFKWKALKGLYKSHSIDWVLQAP